MEITEKNIEVLLGIVRQLSDELHPGKKSASPVSIDSSLDKDLGFDSLARVELLSRIEKAFDAHLRDQVMAAAETPRDLLQALSSAGSKRKIFSASDLQYEPLEKTEEAPVHAKTLVDVLDWHVRIHPDRPHVLLYGEDDKEEVITYAALWQGASEVAAGLLEQGLSPGQAVGIMLPTSRDYFFSFFGILLAGGVPVPLYPPVRLSQIEDHLRRPAAILNNAGVSVLITLPEARPIAWILKSQVMSLQRVMSAQELLSAGGLRSRPPLNASDTAFLQYTSGSTGTPKGVVLTHDNLLSNIRAMGRAVDADSTDIYVIWLPLYHDMRLIGARLGSLYFSGQLVLMSPLSFLTRPERWLLAIHRHRGTISGGPNFAYELCLRKIQDRDIEGLDLSSWRMAFNGAEPVSPETIVRFQDRFAAYGFHPWAMAPVYGLAESSVGLAFPPYGRGPVTDRIRREPFMRSGRALPAETDDRNVFRFVSCGQPLAGHEIRIVDHSGREMGEREEGRLQFRGPSATAGYFRNAEETRRLFDGDWLDSGDMAYMAGGEVYLTGRSKDIIIRAGQNIYPHEVEETVGNIPGIRKGCVAVFGSADPASGTERLVVLAETRETEEPTLEKLKREVHAATIDLIGAPPDEVVLAPPHTVLKTSSGKIRRAASRDLYERGSVGKRQKWVWWQIVRLTCSGFLPQLQRFLHWMSGLIYAAYAWALFGVLAVTAWALVAVVPGFSLRYRLIRSLARLLMCLTGIPLTVRGDEHLRSIGHCVLVSNHASYLDSLILVAALPCNFSYVAKRELTRHLISRLFLRRIRTEFVERFDKQRGVEDARKTARAVQQGRSLIFFPEGTFYRMPGLHPFHMGAFVAAAEAGVPVIPVSIRGSRSILRADTWFPRRAALSVTISEPILPKGRDWAAALELRDSARKEILRHCGEPDLLR